MNRIQTLIMLCCMMINIPISAAAFTSSVSSSCSQNAADIYPLLYEDHDPLPPAVKKHPLVLAALVRAQALEKMEAEETRATHTIEIPTTLCHAPVHNVTLLNPQHARHIFIGTGLWSHKYGLTQGLPIDVLVMLITAHQVVTVLKRTLHMDVDIILLIADHVAIESGAAESAAHARAQENKIILQTVATALKIPRVSIIFSSSIIKKPEYQHCHTLLVKDPRFTALQTDDKEHANYLITQTALGHYMHLHAGVAIKISWAHSLTCESNFDEQWFDKKYSATYGNELNFIYTKAGLAYQKTGNVSRVPYTHTPLHERTQDMRLLFHDSTHTMRITLPDIKKMSSAALSHYKGLITALQKMGCSALQLTRPDDNNYSRIEHDLNHIINLSKYSTSLDFTHP